jgi:hypothetical protein
MLRFLLGSLLLGVLVLPASAADYRHGFHWAADLPPCDTPGVIASVTEKFAYANTVTFHTNVLIEHVDGIRESALKAGGPSLIDRRYCRAEAWLSNGRRSEVVYLIESRQGFASIGWNVESCLPGYDPYHVYDGWCRSIRP